MDYTLLGKRIRDERLLQRLTLEKLAERVDKSINFIGQIERGESKPSVDTLVDIANALGTSVDSLLRGSLSADDDRLSREINALLPLMDRTGKEFIREVIRQYINCHKNENP